jgi:hypothetical protein
MLMRDFKIFALIGLVAAAGYWFVLSPFKGKTWNVNIHQEPTIQFVPPGTPGAMTMEEYTQKRYGPTPRR